MKIFIYGCGAFGLALSEVLSFNGHQVTLYCLDKSRCEKLNKTHIDSKYFENVKLSDKLNFTDDINEIKFFNIVLIAVPSGSIKSVCETLNLKIKDKKVLIINATKGLEPTTNSRILEYLRNNLSKEIDYELASILGPGFAKTIINKDFTCVNSVSKNLEVARYVQNLFSNEYFRVYALQDEIGAEFSSSIKNAIAIACGILEGTGEGINAISALITRGLNELSRFGLKLGAKKDTFFGLSGVGDLILACTSQSSRNNKFGYLIGQEKDVKKVLKTYNKTVEGYNVVKVIKEIADQNDIEMPIINALYGILYQYRNPETVIRETMKRPLKIESFE